MIILMLYYDQYTFIRNEYLNSKFNSDCYYLCMCHTFDHYMKPLSNNNYYHNLEIMKNDMIIYQFSFEQSYYLVKEKDNEFNLDWLPKDYKDDAKMRKYDLRVGYLKILKSS